MKESFSDRTVLLLSYVFLGLFACMCLYPLLLVLSISFSDETTVLLEGFKLIPQKISFDAYRFIWENSGVRIARSYGITLMNTVIGTLAAILVTSLMAHTMSQKHVKYRNAIALFAYFTVIFSAGLVPWYIVNVQILHLKNTLFALFLPYLINVWNLFLLRNFFQSIPSEIIESVKIDGASEITLFAKIVMPLSRSAVLTVSFFYALTFWNDWWLPIMLVTKPSLFTLQYYLFAALSNVQALANNNNLLTSSAIKLPTQTIQMAITIITIGPIIFLYPFIQKYFVKGIMVGAVKG
jgi:putative aldouronate transport system permease protein